MKTTLHKTSIIKKTMQVGGVTLVSRLLGLLREIIQARYLGATIIADAFITAFKIPNSLRKIFAEGALSAAFVPVIVKAQLEDDKRTINSFMTLSFLLFEGILIFLCLVIFFKAESVVRIIAPGWFSYHIPEVTAQGIGGYVSRAYHLVGMWLYPESYQVQPGPQVAYAVSFLRILISFIIFISSSALFAGALHSVNHFFVPAFAPVIYNVVYILGLIPCIWFGLPVSYLCWFILGAGVFQFLVHFGMYVYLGFGFGPITRKAWKLLRLVLVRFLPCIISMSVMEISLFIDTSLASFLPGGSMMQIYLSNRFVGIPLGVFATAFSTILLPHFSRVSVRSQQRFSFYLLETTKLVLWVTIPVALFMMWWSDKIFLTLFLSKKFPLEKVVGASHVLIAFASGLFFYSINKILLSMYYAFHETRIPTIITVLATVINFIVNLMLLELLQATGLALATTISAVVQTALFVYYLKVRFDIVLNRKRVMKFLLNYIQQLLAIGSGVVVVYYAGTYLISLLPPSLSHLLLNTILFWFWAGPLAGGAMLVLYMTRKRFNVRLFFVD